MVKTLAALINDFYLKLSMKITQNVNGD